MTIRWPCGVLRSKHVTFDPAWRSLAGPASLSGASQAVSSDAGIWKATFGEVLIKDRNHVLTFRAINNLLEGRMGTILVPRCGAYQPKLANWKELIGDIPHSDDTLFSDGVGYVGAMVSVVATAAAPVRAVQMTVVVQTPVDIWPGQDFSIGQRMYRVRSFDPDTGAMTFRPPLREAVAKGADLNFDDPVCLMRLATDQEMDLELQMRRSGNPTVNFVEAV